MSTWKQIKKLCFWIFYQKPLTLNRRNGLTYDHLNMLYRYAYIFILTGWVIPWITILIWYAIVVQGCTSNHTRHLLGDVCIGPYLSLENDTPWYLDLWNKQDALSDHTDVRPSPYIENIMISDVKVAAIEEALRQQARKLGRMHSAIDTTELLNSLGNAQVMPPFVTISLPTDGEQTRF